MFYMALKPADFRDRNLAANFLRELAFIACRISEVKGRRTHEETCLDRLFSSQLHFFVSLTPEYTAAWLSRSRPSTKTACHQQA
jgi:hypothetical protein